MRAPSVLAAVVLSGTVLLGGAGQALAGEEDMGIAGSVFGNSSQSAPEFGQEASGSEQDASGFGQGGSVFDLR
ncbi:hypothetical protein ACIBAG_31315 [Streptomyces sp. NPDC051243]|uniref:hypothetical protein n=1 Tax=Streptomyces sp. NPDC051243 TaxID=3365646 RepID=UPI0037B0D255